MRKTTSLFLLLLVLSGSVFAQNTRETDFRFAFVLSPQISWLKSDNSTVDGNGSLFGYNFGIEMDKFFAKNYAISSGLTINTTGGKLKYDNTNTTEEYRLKYIEVPFRLKLQTSDFQRSSFYGVFGLSSMFNIKTNDGSGNNINDDINFFNVGYQFGGGMQYSIGGDAYLKFGLTYNQGLTDVTDDSSVNVNDKATLNRLVFNFGIIF
ncbi:porin family protein [Plebeiibacterium marinum]|uniref:PorT family protein n=1 Tax=Plebeiibacterium marinum TaxID=2992111 RepID=A0AAE3MAV8_9BACT|nr:porin family protein [Plebeiobacterium marinum]MCW3804061.1 PorT family protein [Plebeiobacterium marinum]